MYLSTENAETLRKLLNANPGIPLIFVTRADEEQYDSQQIIGVDRIEKGKVIDDPEVIKDDVAITSDEGLRMMIGCGVSDDDYLKDPDGYMRYFAEQAARYKKQWRPAIIVHMDVKPDEEEW